MLFLIIFHNTIIRNINSYKHVILVTFTMLLHPKFISSKKHLIMATLKMTNLEEIQETIASNLAVLIYFNTESCNVGEAFLPKVEKLVSNSFPKIKIFTVDLNFSPEIAAHYSAFVEPTVLVFYDGKETVRKSRNISVFELEEAIARPYKLIFE